MLMLCLTFREVGLEDKRFCCRVPFTSGKTLYNFRVDFIRLTHGDRPRLRTESHVGVAAAANTRAGEVTTKQ